jgi:hypothetical protein
VSAPAVVAPAASAPAASAPTVSAPATAPATVTTPPAASPVAPRARPRRSAPAAPAGDVLAGSAGGRPTGGAAFAQLPAAAPRTAGPAAEPRPAGGGGGDRTITRTITRTVTEAVQVIPAFLWAVIGGLALACVLAAGASSFLAGRTRRLARQREALLEDVGLLQSALLPPAPAQVPGAVASAAYRPAAGRPAGGDFHDVFAIDADRLGLVVGRVSATGRRALGMTALVRHVLRAYLEGGIQPRNALQVGADVLGHHLGADYAEVTLATYDAATGELVYASAGMPPPIVLGAAAFEPVTASAPAPIGMGVRTGTRQTSVVLPAGAVACFFTAGLVDSASGGYRGAWTALAGLDERGDASVLVDRVVSGSGVEGAGSFGVSGSGGEGAGAFGVSGSGIEGAVSGAGVRDDVAAVLLRIGDEVSSAGDDRRVEELELGADDLRGERPGLFLRDCGVPTDRIDPLVADLRETGRRLGGAVLRVRIGAGVPEAETALRTMDVLHAGS